MSSRKRERKEMKTNKENFKRMPRANPIKPSKRKKENFSFRIKRLRSLQIELMQILAHTHTNTHNLDIVQSRNEKVFALPYILLNYQRHMLTKHHDLQSLLYLVLVQQT